MNDGGQAFPHGFVNHGREETYPSLGMSLRDWFAGMALQGLIGGCLAGDNSGWTVEGNVFAAYQYADAMQVVAVATAEPAITFWSVREERKNMNCDQFDKQAEELLPCEACNGMGKPPHTIGCPANYRPAVAAALREQANSVYDAFEFTGKQELDGARVEITKLKAENERLRKQLENRAQESPFIREEWNRIDAENVRLTKERDEARQEFEQAAERQRALENAIVILTKHNGWDLMMNDAEYRLVKEVKTKYTILAQDVKP